jgi:hypothetical protein
MTNYNAELIPCHCPMGCAGELLARVVVEIHNDPEAMASIRRGLRDVETGHVVKWSELKRKYAQ